MTLPMMTLLTSCGATLAATRADLAASSAKSVALWSLRTPPYVPNGVLLAETIKIPRPNKSDVLVTENYQS